MEQKNILITGSTDGIGKQVAIELARLGHRIILHGRNISKVNQTAKEINELTNNSKLEEYVADFTSFKEVKEMVLKLKNKFDCIDVLINNAGVYMNKKIITEDGYETTFQVNHLSHFLLTNLLIDLIKSSSQGRIINVSSIAHQSADFDLENLNGEKYFSPYNAYAVSKFANILFTKKLAEYLNETKITVNALHPGVISTKLLRAGFNISGASVKKGAETPVYLAISPEVENISCEYFIDKRIEKTHPDTYNKFLLTEFWNISAKMVGLDNIT